MIKFPVFVVIILFLASLTSVFAAVTADNYIADKYILLSMVNQEPNPIEPGKFVEVNFKIVNYGQHDTGEITVGIKPEYPFTVRAGQELEQTIGILESRQYGDISEIFDWELLVDKDAPEGESTLTVYYKERTGSGAIVYYEEDFSVDVRTSDSVLTIADITTSPEVLEPGQAGDVVFTLQNLADNFIKDVSVRLNLDGLSLATLGSTDTRTVQKMDGGETLVMRFTIFPDADINVAVHKIPLEIDYKDNLNNEYSQNESFGLKVSSPIEYLIYVEDSDITAEDQTGDVSVRISNIGVPEIKFVSTTLLPSPDYEILSTSETYVGNIDSDDYESVSYTIHSKNASSPGDLTLRLRMEYKDSYNTKFTSDEAVTVQLFSADQAKQYGLVKEQSKIGLIIVVLIIAGVIVFFWLRNKKKKREQK